MDDKSKGILDFGRDSVLEGLLQRLEERRGIFCGEVCRAAFPYIALLLASRIKCSSLVLVCDSTSTAELMLDDLVNLLAVEGNEKTIGGRLDLLEFPSWDIVPGEDQLPTPDTVGSRLKTLSWFFQRGAPNEDGSGGDTGDAVVRSLICTSISALIQKTYSRVAFSKRSLVLRVGGVLDPMGMVGWAVTHGFESVGKVTQKGEIAKKGGIVDIWPLSTDMPVRVEFFGNVIESLRSFDPISQLSAERLSEVWLPPAGELAYIRESDADLECAERPASLVDWLPRESVVLFLAPESLVARWDEYVGKIPSGDTLHFRDSYLFDRLQANGARVLFLSELPSPEMISFPESWGECTRRLATLCLGIESLEAYRPIVDRVLPSAVEQEARREFFLQISRWRRKGYAVHVLCSNESEARRFKELWAEFIHPDSGGTEDDRFGESPEPYLCSLHGGFVWHDLRLVFVTDNEIFGRRRQPVSRQVRGRSFEVGPTLIDFDLSELEVGDLVVHATYGIGKFLGLETVTSGPVSKSSSGRGAVGEGEYIVIEYAPRRAGEAPPKLYVPLSQAHLVSRYIGTTAGGRVKLNTLGGKKWARTKAEVERAVMDLAAELLSIQAARATLKGHAFGPDTPWQRELESTFPYEETPDQLRAIYETKADMEKPRPMDRLICGDVGFGKTEVAIRAAFKAVMDGKQVAVLAPTTVLAQQHYNTFRERMAQFPVTIELLSRFRSRKEQIDVIERLARGTVDIVIGTHRLLQDDVVFRDLGLVIIDEEQRFGVLHKEKLKKLRLTVDVLTMTATPIPRTMYMALCGLRDISVIQTPPRDRLPIETFVIEPDDRLIRSAILRELERGGQIFYLHNRVSSIQQKAEYLKTLVPEARVIIAHGQMPSDQLERNMARFVNGEADILLCTAIIENGIDIPRANTIIIDRADRFGLSQLYQLRGRVGRYSRQAYAYLVLPKHLMLLKNVRQRISTIRQFSALGSGFKVALRDLEIRGVGNLLGREQSGHIAAVGFDLYCKLLKRAVDTLRGIPQFNPVEVDVQLDFVKRGPGDQKDGGTGGAYLPSSYIPDIQQRIEIYRKIAQAESPQALASVVEELQDRFGPLPEPARVFVLIAELKLLAAERGITAIRVESNKLMITRNGELMMSYGRFPRLKAKNPLQKLLEIKRIILQIPPMTLVVQKETSQCLVPRLGSKANN